MVDDSGDSKQARGRRTNSAPGTLFWPRGRRFTELPDALDERATWLFGIGLPGRHTDVRDSCSACVSVIHLGDEPAIGVRLVLEDPAIATRADAPDLQGARIGSWLHFLR